MTLARRASELKPEATFIVFVPYPAALSGRLREAEFFARRGLSLAKDGADAVMALTFLGLTLAIRGEADDARVALRELAAIEIGDAPPFERVYLAQLALWQSDLPAAVDAARAVVEAARTAGRFKQQAAIQAERIQGEVALAAGDLARAADHLSEAVTRAHAVNHAEEGLPALVALAEVRRRQRDLAAARDLIVEAQELGARGPYPVFHADACLVLARIAIDEHDPAAAAAAATEAYRLSWCDGPPFAYRWGLEAARAILAGLGAPEPADLLPFDDARFEPMPEVTIEIPEKFKPRD